MNTCRTRAALFIAMIAWSINSAAQSYEFRSKLDLFTVTINGGTPVIDGQSVSARPMEDVKTLFSVQFEDHCDMSGVGRPDLTVTRTNANGEAIKRMIYISSRLISDGKSRCGKLTGQGLYLLPFHRKWFNADDRVTIGLRDKFSIWKDGRKVIEFHKTENGYRNTDPAMLTNWEFFEKFRFAIKDFPIDFRAHPDAARDFTGFELRDDERTFKFVKVGDRTWAVQFPGVPWLAASGQLGVFGDMNPQVWISPHSDTLKILSDKTAAQGARLKAATAVFDRWVPDVKAVFYEVLLDTEDDVNLRRDLTSLLKQKPTDENFKVLVQMIQKEQDFGLLNHVTKILRIKNPKGSVIQLDDDDATKDKKAREWQAWARSL